MAIAVPMDAATELEGSYANAATRAMAFLIDIVAIATTFAFGAAVLERMLGLLTRSAVDMAGSPLVYELAFVGWAFIYCAYPLATVGHTFGMSILGLRAVRGDGTD